MTDDDRARRHRLLHRLWSKAVGTPGYDKQEWKALEDLLLPTGWIDQDESRVEEVGVKSEQAANISYGKN